MARNLYITAMEPRSGKSVVALGLMELLSARVERLGFFRPIVPSRPADPADRADPPPLPARRRLRGDARAHRGRGERDRRLRGAAEARRRGVQGARGALRLRPLRGHRLRRRRASARLRPERRPRERARRAGARRRQGRRAGRDRRVGARARESLDAQGLRALRGRRQPGRPRSTWPTWPPSARGRRTSEPGLRAAASSPSWPIRPSAEVAAELDATSSSSRRESLHREVRDVRVGAMSVEHFIEHLVDGALVIVPWRPAGHPRRGLASTVSAAIPTVSGVVLTGGYPLERADAPPARERARSPCSRRRELTHEAAAAVQSVRPVLAARGRAQGRDRARPVRGRRRHGRARPADRAASGPRG